MTRRGSCRGCCCPDPIQVSFSEDGTTLGPSWECDDLDNVFVNGFDDVTVTDDTLVPVQQRKSDDAADGAHTAGATAITTIGSATFRANNSIRFAGHVDTYRVVRHVGNSLEITPSLDEDVADSEAIVDHTPLVVFPDHEAYYAQVSFRDAGMAGIQIVQGNTIASPDNTLTVDWTAQDLTLNSETSEQIVNEPESDYWHTTQLFVCPSHRSAEALIGIVPFPSDGHTYTDYSSVVVDSADYTADNVIGVVADGSVRLRGFGWISGEVVYSGANLVRDCGRHDLFECPWPFWSQYGFAAADISRSGWEEPTFAPWTDPDPIHRHSDPEGCYIEVLYFEIHPFLDGVRFRGKAYYARDEPTPTVPYPEPKSVAWLELFDQDRNDPPCEDWIDTLEFDFGDARDMSIDSFTGVVTIDGSSNCGTRTSDFTVTWNHP